MADRVELNEDAVFSFAKQGRVPLAPVDLEALEATAKAAEEAAAADTGNADLQTKATEARAAVTTATEAAAEVEGLKEAVKTAQEALEADNTADADLQKTLESARAEADANPGDTDLQTARDEAQQAVDDAATNNETLQTALSDAEAALTEKTTEVVPVEVAEVVLSGNSGNPLKFVHTVADGVEKQISTHNVLVALDSFSSGDDRVDGASVTTFTDKVTEILKNHDGNPDDPVTLDDIKGVQEVLEHHAGNENRSLIQQAMYARALDILPVAVEDLKTTLGNQVDALNTSATDLETALTAAEQAVTDAETAAAADTDDEALQIAVTEAKTAAEEAKTAAEAARAEHGEAVTASDNFSTVAEEYLGDGGANGTALSERANAQLNAIVAQEAADVAAGNPSSLANRPGVPYSREVEESQAILVLVGHDMKVDGLPGGEYHRVVSEYVDDNGLDASLKTDPHALQDHLMSRLDTDPELLSTVRDNVISAIDDGGSSNSVKASQIVLNLRGHRDSNGNKLAEDGKATRRDGKESCTQQALGSLKEVMSDEEAVAQAEREEVEYQERHHERLHNKIDALVDEIDDLKAHETGALKIGAVASSLSHADDDNKYGTSFITKVFNEVVPGVLDDNTADKKGRNLMDQFKDQGAYRKLDTDFTPDVGDVVFYGMRGRKVGVVERIDDEGRAVFKDAEGQEHTLMEYGGELKAFDIEDNRAVENTDISIKGIGDTSELIENKPVAAATLGAPGS